MKMDTKYEILNIYKIQCDGCTTSNKSLCDSQLHQIKC